MIGPNAPNAPAISSGGNISLIMPSPCGSITAPTRPWSTRKTINISGDCASAQASDIRVKPAMPTMNIRRRP